jgi:hypothetical protein
MWLGCVYSQWINSITHIALLHVTVPAMTLPVLSKGTYFLKLSPTLYMFKHRTFSHLMGLGEMTFHCFNLHFILIVFFYGKNILHKAVGNFFLNLFHPSIARFGLERCLEWSFIRTFSQGSGPILENFMECLPVMQFWNSSICFVIMEVLCAYY